MSIYRVLVTFKEKKHDGAVYEKGGTYPKGGYETTKKRIEELTSNKNKYKHPFLEKVEEESKVEEENEKKQTVKKTTKK